MSKEEVVQDPFTSETEDSPKYRDYLFKMKSGKDQVATGFLALAVGSVAVGSGSGDLSLIVPLTELHYVKELEPTVGSA